MPDPQLVEYYTRSLRAGFNRAFGNRIGEAHEAEMLGSLLNTADRMADQLEHSILDAPWLRDEVGQLVTTWIEQPGDELDFGELRDSLSAVFGPSRALTIARSEVGQTFNGAYAAGLRAHGWRKVTWIAGDDACEECLSLDGTDMSIEEYEASSTVHPNCSCSAEPSGEDEEVQA
jgi:hypothetical protein